MKLYIDISAIEVEHEPAGPGWQAHVAGNRKDWSRGDTQDEAVGSLVRRLAMEHEGANWRAEQPDAGWIAFSDRMPEPRYDPKNPGPVHGMILVTNNVTARDRWGRMSHVWLATMVHEHPNGDTVINGRTLAVKGEITAFAEPSTMPLRNLTHWRPAVPEEWR